MIFDFVPQLVDFCASLLGLHGEPVAAPTASFVCDVLADDPEAKTLGLHARGRRLHGVHAGVGRSAGN